MSTHALIGKQNPDGTIDAIYLHYDGYPKQAGATLEAHYSSDLDAAALVALAEPAHRTRAQHLADAGAFLAPRSRSNP